MRAAWSEGLAGGLERLLLPNACVVCDRLVPARVPDTLLCGVCRSRLQSVAPGCERCGQPLPPVGPCRFCAEWPPVLASARSAVWLSHEARTLVHHLKYDDYPILAETVADIIQARMPRPAGVLVAIPMGPRKLRMRGYNQAVLIAAALGRIWNLPVRNDLVERPQDGHTQTTLTPEARLANVATVFRVGRRVPPAEVILVDDVLTTGATLRAAAEALGRAKVERISAVTFARALPYEIRSLPYR